jgi:hypothetical protein
MVVPCTMRVVFVVIVVVIVMVVLQVPDETMRILLPCGCDTGCAGLTCWLCGLILIMSNLDFGVAYCVPPSIGADDNLHVSATVFGVV